MATVSEMIKEIENEWDKDKTLDMSSLHMQSIKTAEIYTKYLTYKRKAVILLKMFDRQMATTKLDKYNYHTGRSPQPSPVKILKTEFDLYLEGDPDWIKLQTQKDKITDLNMLLDEILGCISKRSYEIKNAIEYLKYTQGQ